MTQKERELIVELFHLEGAMIAMIAKEASMPIETQLDILTLLTKHKQTIEQLRDPRTPGVHTTGRPIDDTERERCGVL